MLISSVVNSISFKRLPGALPSRFNTLQRNRQVGQYRVIDYVQKFQSGENIKMQFMSDIATDITIEIYDMFDSLISTTTQAYAISYSGIDSRYFFNYELSISEANYDKCIYLRVYQTKEDADYDIISEPLMSTDLTEDIAAGRIMKIEYKNLDRISDSDDYFVDWSIIQSMFFYVEAVNFAPTTKNEVQALQGVKTETILSSLTYSGNELKTGAIPDYLSLKLITASSLDIFLINERQMISQGGASEAQFGQSTLLQTSINFTDKHVIGLNLDDLGIESEIINEMAIISKNNSSVTTTGWTVEVPAGYMVHTVQITHSDTSVATTSYVKLGTSSGGDDLIDAIQGEIIRTEYNRAANKWKIFPKHYLRSADAATNLYFTVTGAGSVLSIFVNLEKILEE